ncbi:unnamed protein product [Calypogeia fissa]
MVRSLLFAALAPTIFWEEFVRAANYINNRCSTRALNEESPYQCITGTVPDVSHFRILGCCAYVHIPKENRNKLQPRTLKCVLLGYDDESKAYRCYDPINRRILISRDVICDETKRGEFTASQAPIPTSILDLFDDDELSADQESTAAPQLPVSTTASASEGITPPSSPIAHVPGTDSPHQHNSPSLPAAIDELPSSKIQEPRQVLCESYLADTYSDQQVAVAFSNPDWTSALASEFEAHQHNNTWELVPHPSGKDVLSCKWVLRDKLDHEGNIKHKARIVARGNEQIEGVDYDETFAPVIKWSTVRLVIALAAAYGWPIFHMDVVTAFLNGLLQEEIYMYQPAPFIKAGQEHLVCRLLRSIYGLKQSPRTWYAEIDNFLRSIGCTRSELDANLYYKVEDGLMVIILIFVDDLLITGSSAKLIEFIKIGLKQKYEMKDLGPARRYLGVDIIKFHDSILLHQQHYAQQLVLDYGMENCRSPLVPLPEGLILESETNTPDIDHHSYCQLVGRLIFLTNTRPDLSFALGLVSRFMHQPQQAHYDASMHIVRYISGTTGLGIFYTANVTPQLEGFTDADWGTSCPDTRRSTGGYLFKLSNGPISWSSKRQPTVSRSTTEAEYKSLSDGAQEGVFLKRELHDTQNSNALLQFNNSEINDDLANAHLPSVEDLHLHCNNISAIKLSRNPVFHARTKHLEIHHHFVHERVLEGELKLKFVPPDQQLADLLTKNLSPKKFAHDKRQIGMRIV